jgi:hypothetical protein
MGVWLGALRRGLDDSVPTALPLLEKMEETLARSTTSLRGLTFELEPDTGARAWAEAIRDTAEHTVESEDTTWTLIGPEDVGLPPIERALALRIVKEAPINVRKHAHAATVTITVSTEDSGVAVAITDDGSAWAPGSSRSSMSSAHQPVTAASRRCETGRRWWAVGRGWRSARRTEPRSGAESQPMLVVLGRGSRGSHRRTDEFPTPASFHLMKRLQQ